MNPMSFKNLGVLFFPDMCLHILGGNIPPNLSLFEKITQGGPLANCAFVV